jgi:type IV pilus assembly protein PilA
MLARIRKMKEDKEEGFTLIELLVVMIIIGILAAIAIPVFLNQQKKGYDASVKSDLRTVSTELNTYYTDNQTYLAVGFGTTATVVVPATTAATAPSAASIWSTQTTNTVGGDAVNISKGTVIQMTYGGANGFCLVGWNTKSSNYYTYDSLLGGLVTPASTATTFAGALGNCKGTGY